VLLALLDRVPVVGLLASGLLFGEFGDYYFVVAAGLEDLDGGGD
jgi:hypothetical protein